jgi:hypothetical protein
MEEHVDKLENDLSTSYFMVQSTSGHYIKSEINIFALNLIVCGRLYHKSTIDDLS